MRRVTSNRRSLETDTGKILLKLHFMKNIEKFIEIFITESEKGSKLDPLPEEKSNQSPTTNAQTLTAPSTSNEPYRRVYPEWKPSTTLEKTDVVGTIEALAGMTC